ncbi:deoxyribose-phosphate aldolase [Natronincola ferrireducens]|uniref:Deoxyribose-phosphate aldolase n=1 Tax=Natronincola ferrireducens TaxID=393762 RepID=A0A1G9GVI5_9FIRM|nr:deoxyribose-phosphate aldolase [Natronincola ferrireducens]SDL04668.1 deoxyribose-phosphate aldolase [Natronincola ferrireducens]
MEIERILSKVDHTLLHTTATWKDIKDICDDGMKYGVASVCIPPSYVEPAKQYVGDRLAICTVIGFPNGYNTTEIKVLEAKDAISKGADEIDMVINLGLLKSGDLQAVEDEIRAIKTAVGNKILKVIIETCLLTKEEKIAMCKAVTNAGADFIKTSTGFSTGGATREDIKLFAENLGKDMGIKAAGGIKSLKDAEDFITLGATRLGTSSIVKVLKNQEVEGY